MERLVDPAVMIVAMVVPTLHSQKPQENGPLCLPVLRTFGCGMAIL
jgi:hypothetical protein